MNPFELLNKYHDCRSWEYAILVTHSVLVTQRALAIAEKLKQEPDRVKAGVAAGLFTEEEVEQLDLEFIYEAAMLHDIGFGFSRVGKLAMPKGIRNCYLAHGWWGAEILKKEGFEKHARVASNHIGVGLSAEEIKKHKWPFPAQDYVVGNLAELIISYADLFCSKSMQHGMGCLFKPDDKKAIKKEISGFHNGAQKVKIFETWDKVLGEKGENP